MRPLSLKQNKFLSFIKNFALTQGEAPTYDEIMAGLGFRSLGTVNWYVNALENEGYLRRTKGSNGKRALTLTQEHATHPEACLPLLGLIAAGEPIEALETPDSVTVPSSLVHPDNFVLQWVGRTRSPGHKGVGYLSYLIRDNKFEDPSGIFVTVYDKNMNSKECLGEWFDKKKWTKHIEKTDFTNK